MSQAVAWALLILSGLLDVAWALSMKFAEGYTRPGWSLLSFALLGAFVYLLGAFVYLLGAFVYLLGRTLEVLPVGTAYAVWTGIGAVGTATLGVLLFQEPINAVRAGSIALVIIGIAGLKLTST